MERRNRSLTLWLSCCLLLIHVADAQTSFVAAMGQPPKASERASVETNTSITIPAGTHLLMKLTSPLHTTSATRGSGVYLKTSSPLIADNRIAIPENTRVFGIVDAARRPGRIHGRARLRMRFIQFVLPDDRVFAISGNLQSLPGSTEFRTTDNEGAIEPVDQIDADIYTVAGTTGVGILFGSIGRIGIGVGPGAAIGFGLGLAKVLFTRGDHISLPIGTTVEMILQHPLIIEARPSEVHHDSTTQETDSQRAFWDNPAGVGRNGPDGRCTPCE